MWGFLLCDYDNFDMSHTKHQRRIAPYVTEMKNFADFLSAISGLKKNTKLIPRSKMARTVSGKLFVITAAVSIKMPAKNQSGLLSIKPCVFIE